MAWILALGLLVYANGLPSPLVFDDVPALAHDPAVREVWPGAAAMLGRQRSLTTLTFALDHALHGLDPLRARAVNLAIHLAAALTLFGLVRRVLSQPRFGRGPGPRAHGIALASALLFTVHPLETESVTYLVQRSESLMGLLYLLVLYALVRAHVAERGRGWWLVAGTACVLGMAAKPVMVTAPLVALALDRVVLTRSWGELVRRRGLLHAGLFLSWGVLLAAGLGGLLLGRGDPQVTVGFGMSEVGIGAYAATQPGVVWHYLKLACVPHPLVLDYGWPLATSAWTVVPPAVALACALGLSALDCARGNAAGFLGLAFFAVLAPTSSLVPVRDAAFEHRMYLPLAAVVVATVLGVDTCLQRARARARVGPALAIAAIAVLGALTVARNQDYRDPVRLWRGVVTHAPDNGRGYTALADVLAARGRRDEALDVLRRGVERLGTGRATPTARIQLAGAHNAWGNLLLTAGDVDGARAQYRAAEEAWELPETVVNWGSAERRIGHYQEARACYEEALRRMPGAPGALNNLAWLLATCPDDSIRDGARALELAQRSCAANRFELPDTLDTLAAAWAEVGDLGAATRWQERALALTPTERRAELEAHLAEYRGGHALREGPATRPIPLAARDSPPR